MMPTRGVAELISNALVAEGLPLVRIEIDERAWLRSEPDEVREERRWALGRQTTARREFWSPLFRWRFQDGRDFCGKPNLKLSKQVWGSSLVGGERHREDVRPMLEELTAMVRRSFERGADAPETER